MRTSNLHAEVVNAGMPKRPSKTKGPWERRLMLQAAFCDPPCSCKGHSGQGLGSSNSQPLLCCSDVESQTMRVGGWLHCHPVGLRAIMPTCSLCWIGPNWQRWAHACAQNDRGGGHKAMPITVAMYMFCLSMMILEWFQPLLRNKRSKHTCRNILKYPGDLIVLLFWSGTCEWPCVYMMLL